MARHDGQRPGASRRSAVLSTAIAILAGLLGSGAMVWQGTSAVFSATTSNGPDSWTMGSVTLGDDDSGAAMFSSTGLVPGGSGSNCIAVSYTGDVATTIKLYASASADASTVAQYLDLTIQDGTGGGYGSCGAFTPGSTIYSGTLAAFTAASFAYGSGVGAWATPGAANRTYKITYTLNASTPNTKQAVTTTATFQWEAQA